MIKREEVKRKNSRFQFSKPVPTSFIVMGDFIHIPSADDIQCEIVDISTSGMRIKVNGKPPEKGSVIRILIPIPIAPDVQTVVPILTQVRWVKRITNKDHNLGLLFMV
jgi:hypothetical protein